MVITSVVGRCALLTLVGLLAACGSPPPTSHRSTPQASASLGPPILGIDWGRAQSVARPEGEFTMPSPGSAAPDSSGTDRSGHPLHFPGQAIMADVARLPSRDLVSIGYVYPQLHPIAWTSPDGETWSLRQMGTTPHTLPVAMAIGSTGTVVAVGWSASAPVAWTSADGRTWQAHAVAILGDGRIAERITTVLTTRDGYLAGGSVGPELLDRHARFWRSIDGSTWQPVPDDAGAFANAEVRAIARLESGYVALGTVGNVQRITGSVAWTSPDGLEWTRIDTPALDAGRAVALVNAPSGGLVAVGSDLGGHEALAWVSADGRSWTLAPSEPSRQFHGSIRMTDVTVAGDELVAIGDLAPLQRTTATSWVSHDGLRWERANIAPVQEQAEFYAVAPTDSGVVAVGSFGEPDDYIPSVWLSPSR
jgi:hypothetical protein